MLEEFPRREGVLRMIPRGPQAQCAKIEPGNPI
jgi:hypothetical protein